MEGGGGGEVCGGCKARGVKGRGGGSRGGGVTCHDALIGSSHPRLLPPSSYRRR